MNYTVFLGFFFFLFYNLESCCHTTEYLMKGNESVKPLKLCQVLLYKGMLVAVSSVKLVVTTPVSILRKSTSGRHRPVSYPDGPMTARYRST